MDMDTLHEHSERTDGALGGAFGSTVRRPGATAPDSQHPDRCSDVCAVAVVAGVALLLPRSASLPVAEERSTTTASVTTTRVVTDDPVALTGAELIATQWTSHKLGTDPRAVIGVGSISYVESKGFYRSRDLLGAGDHQLPAQIVEIDRWCRVGGRAR